MSERRQQGECVGVGLRHLVLEGHQERERARLVGRALGQGRLDEDHAVVGRTLGLAGRRATA